MTTISRKHILPVRIPILKKTVPLTKKLKSSDIQLLLLCLSVNDVIIVSSVSCIYSLGDPIDYRNMVISLRQGMQKERDDLLHKLVQLQYERNDINFVRNKFRVRGDVVEIFPSYSSDTAIRVEFFGDEIDRISEINTVTGEAETT